MRVTVMHLVFLFHTIHTLGIWGNLQLTPLYVLWSFLPLTILRTFKSFFEFLFIYFFDHNEKPFITFYKKNKQKRVYLMLCQLASIWYFIVSRNTSYLKYIFYIPLPFIFIYPAILKIIFYDNLVRSDWKFNF